MARSVPAPSNAYIASHPPEVAHDAAAVAVDAEVQTHHRLLLCLEQSRRAQLQMVHDCMRDMLGSYQARIAAVPSRETELVELTRDYETLRQSYTNLLAKSENARMSANLERRQIGEQFRVLEPARLPERPISPNRLQINAMGALAGLAAGLGLLLFLEYRDRSMRTEADVRAALGLPVLAVIRTLGDDGQRRRRAWGLPILASRWR